MQEDLKEEQGIYCREDFSSHANTDKAKVNRYDVKLWPSLKNRTLKTHVKYYFRKIADSNVITLDVMDIDQIKVLQDGNECKYDVSAPTDIGSRLTVHLLKPLQQDSDSTIEIISLTSKAKSLTWGEFVFTQNEPIYCRSLFPCQDTPSVKSTFDIDIVLEEQDRKLNVFATGLRKGNDNKFTMEIPIPTYLFAFLIGNFEQRKINHRIGVVAEPQEIEACVKELDELETYISILENLMFPYQWTEYNICILPRSFPYGGMENPIYTFASPSIITGDKSGISVAVHEIAHSWTGNLISCRNWENFWMNEGFTVYFENNALRVLNGEEFYQVNSIVEQKLLLKTIDQFSEKAYTALSPKLGHANPDDAYSIIPYYKGYLFLTFLEQLLGLKPFHALLNRFLKRYVRKSVDWLQFREEFYAFVADEHLELKEDVNWNDWINKPGYPPRLDLFKSERIEQITRISALVESDPEKFDGVLSNLLANKSPLNVRLLQVLLHLCQQQPVSHATLKRIDDQFSLSSNLQNFDLMNQWFQLCLKNRYMNVVPLVESRLLQKIGRMKFIRPIYRELKNCDPALATSLFERNKHHYSAIANDLIVKDLAKA